MGLSLMCVLFKKKKINFNFSSEIDDLSTQQRKENKKGITTQTFITSLNQLSIEDRKVFDFVHFNLPETRSFTNTNK